MQTAPPQARLRPPAMSLLLAVAGTLIATGCAHRVSWEVQPVPTYTLPAAPTTMLAVVADGRQCKAVADAVAASLNTRPGVKVSSEAAIRLIVQNCDQGQETTLEVEMGGQSASGFNGTGAVVGGDRRRYTLHGWSAAEMTVISPSGNEVILSGTADQTVRSSWVGDADMDVPRAITLADALAKEVAANLANQLAPLPVSLHRRLYADAAPGSAKDLHNRAVSAEQAGDLVGALDLARQAQAVDPSRAAADYLDELRAHAVTVGYLLPR